MSDPATAMFVVSLFSTGYSIMANEKAQDQQKAAIKESKRIANRNAERIEAETKEQARREKLRQQAAESRALAKSAASGVKGESRDEFLKFMGEEHARQLGWLKRSGRSEARITRMGGNAAAARGRADLTRQRAASVGTAAEGAGSAYTWGNRAYGGGDGWWGN